MNTKFEVRISIDPDRIFNNEKDLSAFNVDASMKNYRLLVERAVIEAYPECCRVWFTYESAIGNPVTIAFDEGQPLNYYQEVQGRINKIMVVELIGEVWIELMGEVGSAPVHRTRVIFDKNGGATLQLDCYGHYYRDMQQLCDDIWKYLRTRRTDGWEGHEQWALMVDPSYAAMCSGQYCIREISEYDTVLEEDTAWYHMDTVNQTINARHMGRKGGRVKSPVKTGTSRENGKKGGRPRKVVE